MPRLLFLGPAFRLLLSWRSRAKAGAALCAVGFGVVAGALASEEGARAALRLSQALFRSAAPHAPGALAATPEPAKTQLAALAAPVPGAALATRPLPLEADPIGAVASVPVPAPNGVEPSPAARADDPARLGSGPKGGKAVLAAMPRAKPAAPKPAVAPASGR